jgi:hypothetical protein
MVVESFEGVLQTRQHWYPTWIIFITPITPPTLVKRATAGVHLSDLAIESGRANPDSIADSIHLIDRCQLSLLANEFLRMLVNPKHYRKGWIDFLKVVAPQISSSDQIIVWAVMVSKLNTKLSRFGRAGTRMNNNNSKEN